MPKARWDRVLKRLLLLIAVALLSLSGACTSVDQAADRPGGLATGEVGPNEPAAGALDSDTPAPSTLPRGGPDNQETVIVRVRTRDYEQIAPLDAVHAIDYGSFVWLELAPSQFAELQASGVRYVLPPRPTVLQFQEYRFDTRFEEPMVPQELHADITNGKPQLYVLQHVGPPKDEWRNALEASDVEFIRPHPPNAYTVRMTPEQAAAAAAQDFVRWVGPYHPAFKLHPNLAEAASGGGDNGTKEVWITIYDDGQSEGTVEQTIQALQELGGELVDRKERISASAPVQAAVFRLPVSALVDAARLEAVVGIDNVARPAIEE